ncbi:kinase-like protein [Gymnopus androsaceus JB14]|uniref:Kinase-like protein n=1 Tax=Gymnopus androsaceus JB14 TaxID=1447944 RepID=A0A6A4I0Y9_9AGAR|nr:kinase-like protein [Gymnopus androsaceus JB14]
MMTTLQTLSSSTGNGGSVRWMAPEFFDYTTNSRPSTYTDMYSLGCTIYEIVTGSPPFSGQSDPAVIFHVMGGSRPLRPTEGFSDRLWIAVGKCWVDPDNRHTVKTFMDELLKMQPDIHSNAMTSLESPPQDHYISSNTNTYYSALSEEDCRDTLARDYPHASPVYPAKSSPAQKFSIRSSSLLDIGRATDEVTSKTPSITRTEGSSIAEDLARKHREPFRPFSIRSSAGSSPQRSEDPSGSQLRPDKLHQRRGRFRSDEELCRRRLRQSSYSELRDKLTRSRFESMVDLGRAPGNTCASDLMSRDSTEGSAVHKPLIIKEEGKVPTYFQLSNCIGRGQFGSVHRAVNLDTGQMVAVKRIRLEGLKEQEVTQLMREVDLVKRLFHPSITKCEGMHRDADTLSIVLEYAENGSLDQTVKAFGKLNEKLVASYVIRILEGLHYLHKSGVVHCGLKATNILATKNDSVKLSDFGISLNMRAVERGKDVAGIPNWMAPEVIELKGASPKSDIWSLACTVIELLTGHPPYHDIPNSMSVMFRIIEDDMPPIPPGVSPLLEDFLKKCFHKDPAQRPTAELLCEHQWLKQNRGVYKELRPPFLRRVNAKRWSIPESSTQTCSRWE